MIAPSWLEDMQLRFGRALRAPLDRREGRLRAATAAYDPRLCDAVRRGGRGGSRRRIAVYNRQYWLRLFGLMGKEFLVTARLVGHWHFNGLVTRFLLENPPAGWDIEQVPVGFEHFLERTVPSWVSLAGEGAEVPRVALLQAARIDAAQRRLFLAGPDASYEPSPHDVQRLVSGRLALSDRVEIVAEDWPLVELRRRLLDDPGDTAVPVPERLDGRRYWALVRTDAGVGELALEPEEGALFELVGKHPLGEALARLERTIPEAARAQLPARVQRWLARSVHLGFWRGLEPRQPQ